LDWPTAAVIGALGGPALAIIWRVIPHRVAPPQVGTDTQQKIIDLIISNKSDIAIYQSTCLNILKNLIELQKNQTEILSRVDTNITVIKERPSPTKGVP